MSDVRRLSSRSAAFGLPPHQRTAAGGFQHSSASKPDALLYLLTLMIWTYVWRVQDLFPILGTLKISLISAALSIGLFAIDRHPARRIAHLKTPVLICACALLGVAALGLPGSLWPARSASLLLKDFIPNVVMMVVLAASVRGVADLEWIALTNVLGACAYSLFVGFTFQVDPDGRLNDLVYYDANELALVLVCTIPFALFFLVRGGWGYRLLGLFGLFLFVATVVKSGSRGGFLGFVAVMVYVLVRYAAVPKRVRFLTVVGGVGLLSLVGGDAYWDKIRTLRNPHEDYNWSGQAVEGRMEVWKRGLRYMADRPFLGVGLRNFPTAEGTLSRESKARAERGGGFKWGVAHNSFVEVGAELGVIGLALFCGMLVFALRALSRFRSRVSSRDRATMRQVALTSTLSAALVGFIVSGFFLSAEYFSYLYLLLAMATGFIKIDRLGLAQSDAWPAAHLRRHPDPRLSLPSRNRHPVTNHLGRHYKQLGRASVQKPETKADRG